MGGLGMRRKGLEDLNVYRHQQERDAKVREDLNVSCVRFFCLKQDGQDAQDEQDDSTSPRGCRAPPKTIGARVARAIKGLTDLFS